MCTGSDGAGPSNAVGALVNQLLGGASKTQEQLRDLPVQQGPHMAPPVPLTPEAAAAAAAGHGMAMPGMAPPSASLSHLDAFFPGAAGPSSSAAAAAAARHTADMVAEFERHQQSLPQMPPGHVPPGALMPGPPPPPMLAATLKAFLAGGAQPGMQALPPGAQLSLPDAVRLRDRATILARQMYGADAGAAVADQQVAALLASLAIDPASLPAELPHQAAPADARLVDALTADGDPKMRNSKFLQFLSKMSKGELEFEDNKVVERAAGDAWASEFGAGSSSAAAAASNWSSEFMQQQGQQQQQQPAAPRDWAAEFADGFANINIGEGATEEQLEAAWAEMGGAGSAAWANEFVNDAEGAAYADWEDLYAKNAAASPGQHVRGEYRFAANNPFLGDPAALEKGRDLFKRGLLSEAALALEAEVQANPQNATAWRLLGTVHAENDDDRQAIAALDKALQASPDSLEVLLALGVSHTNELDAGEALSYLHRWLSGHPTYRDAAAAAGAPPDSSQALSHTVRLFEQVVASHPQDTELQLALGVLHHLNRRYDGAIAAFQRALELRPGDYSLWNKLGATLANYSHSSEAVAAYRKALDLKPNYMRAWTNMGISYANLGDYMASAAYYVRALSMNPEAQHVWGYLRTSLACAGQVELLEAVEAKNLQALQTALPL
ncbi:hypothetical protein OEZ85_012493 [Tetradesmus obliquus]|uniref:Peroxin-5 n=1 Tax=Tetradesmus obliquus TaxID=3088 RepID=A0ABY8TVM3_TETOB|nr:hypothetical protein OEZ85_012493 [Tetradesmus obliquus]